VPNPLDHARHESAQDTHSASEHSRSGQMAATTFALQVLFAFTAFAFVGAILLGLF
jgi:hypothetical protein